MEDLRDSVQVQRGRVRGNTPEGPDFFFIYFFSFLTELRLVSFFFSFLRGPFRCRDICCREDRFTGGTLYWREGCFLSNCQRHLVTDADSQNK